MNHCKTFLCCLSLFLVVGSLMLGGPGLKKTAFAEVKTDSRFINVAHRGASGYAPENTIAAFDKAVEMKADFFELDVQRSKDGHLVVLHDTSVDRTTDGTGYVRDMTLAELKRLDAGSWFSSKYSGEKIPTLEEVLERYRNKRINILIELKKPSLYPGIEQQVANLLREKHMDRWRGKVVVQSFNHDSIRRFHQTMPWVMTGALVSYTSYKDTGVTNEHLNTFARYADFVNPNKKLVDRDLVNRVHQRGMKILPYTVRSSEAADRLFHIGVDGFVTDYPELGYIYYAQ